MQKKKKHMDFETRSLLKNYTVVYTLKNYTDSKKIAKTLQRQRKV